MSTALKGCGCYKIALLTEIAAAYAGKEFAFGEAKKLPSFEYRAFMRLYHAGLLRFSKVGNKRMWKVTQYNRWGGAQPSCRSVAA